MSTPRKSKSDRGTIRVNFKTGAIRATGDAANDLFNALIRAHKLDTPNPEAPQQPSNRAGEEGR